MKLVLLSTSFSSMILFSLARSVVNEKKLNFFRKVKKYLRQRTDLYIFTNFCTYWEMKSQQFNLNNDLLDVWPGWN